MSFKEIGNSTWGPAGLALLTAALLWIGWPVHPAPLALLLLVAWVPYLRLEQVLVQRGSSGWKVFRYSYLTLVLWNAFVTWWVSHATLGGGITAVICNALMMSAPLMAFYHTKRLFGPKLGYLSLPIFWIAFEQLHLTWDLTWPWLTLGNGFAEATAFVQWYEYTGFLGGSVWVWVVNLLLFLALFRPLQQPASGAQLADDKPDKKLLAGAALAVILPLLLSWFIGSRVQEQGPALEVVVVQPNVDPYTEKFQGKANFVPYDEQLTRLLKLSEQKLTPKTKLVIWPETALEEYYFEQQIEANPKINRIRQWLAQHPGVALLTGITSVVMYPNQEAASVTARHRDDMGYYDVFNSGAYFRDAVAPIQFYHKSRLVPGVEKIPPLLTSIIAHIDLGGTVGSYGSQDERTVFTAPAGAPGLRVAPLICYESIYGDFTAEYVKGGATLLGLFTNDAWWHDSPGYRQLLRYGALRSIETRRDLARSANTGFTGFINQKGEMFQRETAWIPTASRATVHLNTELTFYVRYGELIGAATQVLAVVLLLALLVKALNRRLGAKLVAAEPVARPA
ncbi:apolipoprotein N-acyltransferase [Hymenobacter sp. BT635]|uniref:Apolipoprotein N-acyltransferase n=1 Tax=Hymenobacter nitidus TaxID=2880929 RepID=A0ABS8ALY1_9BACT|nr:apolipoprotein N-acyltransferase [Hymenobacter nitidus]MCB2380524.1 apolipoprotein N-acyltransferase [Hymenobacter nitidus]